MRMTWKDHGRIIAILTCAIILVGVRTTHSQLHQQLENSLERAVRIRRQFNNGPFRGFPLVIDGVDLLDPAFYNPTSPRLTTQTEAPLAKRQVDGTNSELIFNNNGPTQPTPASTREPGLWVLINNRPQQATIPPFSEPTTPRTEYMNCLGSCQTTNEYNPICGSNQQLYFNEQKFNCARACGADIQIVRKGSCEGLFPMQRG